MREFAKSKQKNALQTALFISTYANMHAVRSLLASRDLPSIDIACLRTLVLYVLTCKVHYIALHMYVRGIILLDEALAL